MQNSVSHFRHRFFHSLWCSKGLPSAARLAQERGLSLRLECNSGEASIARFSEDFFAAGLARQAALLRILKTEASCFCRDNQHSTMFFRLPESCAVQGAAFVMKNSILSCYSSCQRIRWFKSSCVCCRRLLGSQVYVRICIPNR